MITLSVAPFRKEEGQSTRRPADDYSTLALGIQFPLSGNVTLLQVLAFANVSKAQAYKLGMVPIYANDGTLIENGSNPPAPWLRMPEPVIKMGKKLFDAAEIRAWLDAVRHRARQANHRSAGDDLTQRAVTA